MISTLLHFEPLRATKYTLHLTSCQDYAIVFIISILWVGRKGRVPLSCRASQGKRNPSLFISKPVSRVLSSHGRAPKRSTAGRWPSILARRLLCGSSDLTRFDTDDFSVGASDSLIETYLVLLRVEIASFHVIPKDYSSLWLSLLRSKQLIALEFRRVPAKSCHFLRMKDKAEYPRLSADGC